MLPVRRNVNNTCIMPHLWIEKVPFYSDNEFGAHYTKVSSVPTIKIFSIFLALLVCWYLTYFATGSENGTEHDNISYRCIIN